MRTGLFLRLMETRTAPDEGGGGCGGVCVLDAAWDAMGWGRGRQEEAAHEPGCGCGCGVTVYLT